MEADSLSISTIISIIGGILAVLIKLFDVINGWKKSRENNYKLEKGIQHNIEAVSFINSWVEAVNSSATDKERDTRQQVALQHLDHLMENYQKPPGTQTALDEKTDQKKDNKLFYAMSVFLFMAVAGLFVDDDDNWSASYFVENLDSDTALGFGLFFALWVYFFVNSNWYQRLMVPKS